jgi:hypothetical protein
MGVNVFLGRFRIEFVLLPIALCILPDCRSPPCDRFTVDGMRVEIIEFG